MTDILCNWLNNEVRLSVRVDPANFAKEFSTGYLLGEVLYKYQLQDDFDKFSKAKTADSKLNNFTRVEPVLHLLEVPFDTNVARDVMTERHGVATRLMYQLFIALSKKQKNNLTGVAMETMRPPAPVKLENVESLMYKERLKHMTPRQTDLNLEALVERYHKKQVQMEQVAFKERFEEEERYMQRIQEQREALREKHRLARAKKTEMLAKIHSESENTSRSSLSSDRAATVHIPKPPANKTAKAIAQRKYEKLKKEAEMALAEIEEFEEKLKRTLPPSKPVGLEITETTEQPDPIELIKPSSNDDYINLIRKRLNEDASARAEREKRRRKVLVDQIKAHEAQEDARREEMLVNRLMRQSQQERRIAVQLLQARHEKEVIRKNRMMREKQYEERRLKEFQEALNREAEIARLAKLEYIDQTQKDRELHNKIMAERAKARYTKHYNMCGEILSDIIDFSTKIGEYRELTDKLLPPKLMRDWTTLFVEGKPLYEVPAEGEEDGEPTPEQILEEERQCLLDEADFNEYRNMIGEWQPPEDSDITGPPADNPIIGHIVQRLLDIVHPPSPPPPAPQFPAFPVKACIMGKVFSGKSTACKKLAETHRLQVLDVEALVSEAIEAHKAGEVIEEEPEEANLEEMTGTNPSTENTPASDKQGGVAETPQIVVTPQTAASEKQAEETQGNKEQETPTNAEDGMEKMDPEKPVTSERDGDTLAKSASSIQSTGKTSQKGSVKPSISSMSSPLPQATPRAKLGRKAMHYLKKGRTVEDALLVDIVIEAIKRIPEGTGWVLDGFPATYAQAKLLEKALTGMDVGSRQNSKLEPKDVKGKPKKSVLAPDPSPAPPPPEPVSGLDVVIMFDIPDELALKRSVGRTYAVQADEQYHEEFKPPPEGAATGVNKQEKVIPVEDPSHDQDQIQHRLLTFQDTWPKMEKWFSKFGILHKIEASQEQEIVFSELEQILEETLKKMQGPTTEETSTMVGDGSKQEEKPAEPVKTPEPVEEKPAQVEGESRPSSKKGSRAGSRASSAEKKAKKSGSRASSKEGNKKSSGKGSRGSSPKSPKRSKSGGKKQKTPEPETEPEPEEPPGTPPPQPGSDLWQYVDEPIDEELAHILSSHWETVENTYIGNSKTVFRSIRQERERIIRYLHQIKQDFLTYLRRPDHKQEFIIQWQKEFNEIPDDLRDDDELRCELHQRVDDLRERLWSICDERKEQAEKERETIMMDGWVDDRVGILTNYYVTLVQGEVDRFQDTVRMLKDYYRSMEGKIPDETQSDYIRLPLVELPVEDVVPPEEEQTQESGDEDIQQEDATDDTKPSSGKTASPSGKKKTDEKADDEPEEKKSRIPLVPRRPASPESAAAGAKKPDKAKSKAGKESEDGPPPPSDPDEKLLFDAFFTGVQSMEKLMASEQAAKEAEEEAEKLKEQEREAEKQKAAADTKKKGGKGGAPAAGGGGKGGKKSRSPSPKKGRGKDSSAQATPVPDEGEESEEEKLKKLTRERAKQEFFAALQLEISAAKCRMDLVRHVAAKVIAGLKDKADSSYKDMNDWLGARFLKEMESIDHMSEVMRFAIENGTKIHQELKIDQEDFFIDQDVKVLRSPSPQPRPEAIEKVDPETFTVEQIKNLYHQFSLTAPSGMMSLKTFQEILTDMTSLSHGSEQLPEAWLNLTPEKLEAIAVNLSADGEYIDWHGCLLQLAQPWPLPTQAELLETLEHFKEMDQSNSGFVTREQYERVDLWFSKLNKPQTPQDPAEPMPYDRLANLKKSFFDIFADHSSEPSKLDYIQMLLYFSVAPDPYDGFLRALSVASGTHMPRLSNKKIVIKKPSRPTSEASLAMSDGEAHGSVEAEGKLQEDIPDTAVNAMVPLDALDKVLHHGLNMRGDSHRFSVSADPEDAFSKERLAGIYQELGSEDLEPLPFSKLIEHPVLQDIVAMCNTYRILDIKAMLTQSGQDTLDAQSLRTGD